MVVIGIVAGLVAIGLILALIISTIVQKREPLGGDAVKKKIVVSEQGADVNSGTLGSGSLFRGYGQENMNTVCISQELLQKQTYSARSKHIRLTDRDTGHVWESAFTLEIFIGRKPHPEGRSSIVIAYSGISALHCSVYVDGGNLMIVDRNSTNGTYLNNDAIRTPKRIKTGDVIGLGVKEFVVEFEQ